MKCKLCRSKDADQTGSHILSSALISHCINAVDKNGRDQEFMFGFSQSGKQDFFVGQDVLPEKIEEYNGEALTDEELEENSNELVIDNFFCRGCEKLFGEAESRFAKDLGKIRNHELREVENNLIIRLYFIIQAWRASTCRYNDWEMSGSFEEYCRVLILEICTSLKDNTEMLRAADVMVIPMLLTYLETTVDKSSNLIVITENKDPYILFLCDFVLQLYEAPVDKTPEPLHSFFNLNECNTKDDINYNEEVFHIVQLSNSQRDKLISNTVSDLLVPQFWEQIMTKFIQFSKDLGHIPSKDKLDVFIKVLFDESTPSHKRYKDERIKDIIERIF